MYLPEAEFRRYVARLRGLGLCRLVHARLPSGRSIAGLLVLLSAHPVTHTVCAGAESEYLKLGASAFVRWKAFEALSRLGYQANDLTDATLSPVTHFKSQLGGDLVPTLELSRPEASRYRWYVKTRGLMRGVTTLAQRSGRWLTRPVLGRGATRSDDHEG